MIVYGQNDRHFYCFDKDAAANEYPILHVELVKTRKDNRDVLTPHVRECLLGCVDHVGIMEVAFVKPQRLVDFSKHPPEIVRSVEVEAGYQVLEILSIELPKSCNGTRFVEIAVLPGTVFGMAWSGLIKATADYHRIKKYWKKRSVQQGLMNTLTNYLRKLQVH